MRRSLTRTTAAAAALALALSLLGQSPALADDIRPPDRPETSTLTARGEACSTDPDAPTLLNTTTPTLSALITHPDAVTASQQVKAQFEWGLEGAEEPLGSADSAYVSQAPGGPPVTRSVTARDLPEEVLIGYRARGHDTRAWGEWSDRCWIEISTSKPAAPPTVTSDDYPADNRFHGAPGQPGDFTFDANGVDDAVAFYYGLGGSCGTRVEADAPGGSATVSITPTRDGPQRLHARSVDAHGNSSSCASVHSFMVAPLAQPVAYFRLDEGEGAAAHDYMIDGRTAEGTGVIGWARGRVGVRAHAQYHRLERAAVVTSDGHLRTEGSVVDTSGTFTVSAWVRLDDTGEDAVAVSQDGEHVSGFQLGYDASEDAWVFRRADQDGPDTVLHHTATSTDPVQTGVWTRLTGSSDPSTGELTLYVDGVLQDTATQTSEWNAEGAFVIGGGRSGGGFASGWPGAVDDVMAWNRALTTEDDEESDRRSEIWQTANQPVVPEGTWWLREVEGDTADDTSDHGLDAVLHGDPETVWDGAFNDGIWEPGLLLDRAEGEHLRTEGPAVRTDRSFTASAWVRLDDGGSDAVALSQSGSGTSGFALGYDAGLGRWVFETPVRDGTGPIEVHRATSSALAEIGEWVFLAGVYDHTDGTLTLHVDGFRDGGAERVGSWHADGDVVIGGAGHAEGVKRPWAGGVSLAQLHQGAALWQDLSNIEFGIVPVAP